MSLNTESELLLQPPNFIPEPSRRCKVIIVGAKDVGKSTFIERVEFGKFNGEKKKEKLYRVMAKMICEQTLTVEFVEKDLEEFVDDSNKVQQRDMRDVDAMILLYSVEDSDSFKAIKNNLVTLQRKIPPNASITIVGTKADVQVLKVGWSDVDAFAEEQGFSCFETSSKSGVNVEIIVQDVLETVFEKRFATDDVLNDQPVYASTVLSNREEEEVPVNGFCFMAHMTSFSLFQRGGGF